MGVDRWRWINNNAMGKTILVAMFTCLNELELKWPLVSLPLIGWQSVSGDMR